MNFKETLESIAGLLLFIVLMWVIDFSWEPKQAIARVADIYHSVQQDFK